MKSAANIEDIPQGGGSFSGGATANGADKRTHTDVHPDISAFLDIHHGQFINGGWVAGTSDESILVTNPATGLAIASVSSGTAADVDRAVTAARNAFETGPWPAMLPVERARILLRLADLLDQHSEQLSDLESLDSGMPREIMRRIGVKLAADQIRYYAGWVTKLNGETISNSRAGTSRGDFLTYTLKEPVGVVGQIIPWNFPLGIAVQKLAPALAAGCTIIMKPAEEAPLSVTYLAGLMAEAGLPDGVFNVVNGYGATAGAAIASHKDIDKVAFTGSTEVGREILSAASGNMKRLTLELGGKSPFILLADADLDQAIPAAARAITFLTGQNCMAGSRLLVHEDIHDQVLDGLVKAVEATRVGSGLDAATDIGPLISKRQLTRVLAYIDVGVSEGARLVTGGRRITSLPGYFVEPTIFADCNSDMKIVREEIFGPILTVQKFTGADSGDDLDAVAAIANDSIFGLSASIWTRDLAKGHRLAGKIRSGQVGINVHAAIDPATPFGGFKQSGWGRESGKEGLEPYLETKAITAHL